MSKQNNNRRRQSGRRNVVTQAAQRDVLSHREEDAMGIIFPSHGNWGGQALAPRDFTGKVISAIIPYGPSNNNFMRTKLTYSLSPIIQQVTLDTLGALYFSAGLSSGFSDLSTVFDQYMIEAVSVELFAQVTAPGLSAPTTNAVPRLYTCIDYDDSNSPISIDTIRQYDTCIIAPPGTGIVRTLVPRVATAIYGGVSFNAYGNAERQWIDVASPGAQHYGLKYGVDANVANATNQQRYTVDVTLYVAFRATR